MPNVKNQIAKQYQEQQNQERLTVLINVANTALTKTLGENLAPIRSCRDS